MNSLTRYKASLHRIVTLGDFADFDPDATLHYVNRNAHFTCTTFRHTRIRAHTGFFQKWPFVRAPNEWPLRRMCLIACRLHKRCFKCCSCSTKLTKTSHRIDPLKGPMCLPCLEKSVKTDTRVRRMFFCFWKTCLWHFGLELLLFFYTAWVNSHMHMYI